SEARPLDPEPILEGGLGHADAFEQVALVEGRGLLEGRGRARGAESLEGVGIHVDGGRVEGEGVVVDQEDGRQRTRQRLAEGDERLPEALAGLLASGVTPEKG